MENLEKVFCNWNKMSINGKKSIGRSEDSPAAASLVKASLDASSKSCKEIFEW